MEGHVEGPTATPPQKDARSTWLAAIRKVIGQLREGAQPTPPQPSTSRDTPPAKRRKLVKEAKFGERRVLRSLGVAKNPPASPTALRSSY